jgi:hypothetical protein
MKPTYFSFGDSEELYIALTAIIDADAANDKDWLDAAMERAVRIVNKVEGGRSCS